MSIAVLLGLSAALHLYIGSRIVPALDNHAAGALFALLLLASALLTPAGMFARRLIRHRLADSVAAIGLFFMGLFSSLLVGTVLRDVVLLLVALTHAFMPEAFSLAEFARWSARLVVIGAGVVTLLGLWNARRIARVVTVEVPLHDLPQALRGFTIVQISDVHVGPTIRQRYVEGIVDAVNRLSPDVVAITGDLVDGSVAELGGHVAPL